MRGIQRENFDGKTVIARPLTLALSPKTGGEGILRRIPETPCDHDSHVSSSQFWRIVSSLCTLFPMRLLFAASHQTRANRFRPRGAYVRSSVARRTGGVSLARKQC